MDIFLTNRPSLVNHCDITAGISDHEAIIVQSSIIATLQPMRRNIYLWSKIDIQGMKNTALNLCNAFLENNSVSTRAERYYRFSDISRYFESINIAIFCY